MRAALRAWVGHEPAQLRPSRADIDWLPVSFLLLGLYVAVTAPHFTAGSDARELRNASELFIIAAGFSMLLWQFVRIVRHRHSFDA